jgi:glycosyltransferase involved in cell wall biosynthesis
LSIKESRTKRPNISVFTPTYGDSRYLAEAWGSLKAQTYTDWEWVVMINNSTITTLPIEPDDRVRFVFDRAGRVQGVGHAKRIAVAHCKGEILVELDHDDLLEPTCLSEVAEAFERHPEASLVYSRFAQVLPDGSPDPQRFDPAYGWEYDEHNGYLVPRSLEPTPHNVSLIWYAPNHVRAFRRSSYRATSGYDPSLRVLDDLALMSELYRTGSFVPLDSLLYRQRIHGANTQLDLETNRLIQSGSWELYERNILPNYLTWASRNSLRTALNCREDIPWREWREDLEPNTYGLIRCELGGWLDWAFIRDAHWLLAPNGMLSIFVPEGVPYNEHYFRAWCATDHAPFQESRIRTVNIDGRNWTQANLIAVKEGYTREGGILYAK